MRKHARSGGGRVKAHSPGDAMEFKSLNSTVVSTAPLPPTARITLKQETHTINHWLLCHIESNGHASKASFRVLNLESMGGLWDMGWVFEPLEIIGKIMRSCFWGQGLKLSLASQSALWSNNNNNNKKTKNFCTDKFTVLYLEIYSTFNLKAC